jgi:hypothetical protein
MMLLISGMSHPPAFAAPADSPPDRENHPASLPQSGPQADFSASPRAGSAPLAVQFTDRSRVGFPYPALQVSPVYAALTLRRGESDAVAYRVENVGTAATGPVTFSTPTAPGWVSVTPGGLPDLPPGAARR